ncbi:hypothetical protein BOX15_Mlig010739g3 [Macrostomum lignano]|uniref:Uncharacterized protein n=1 Tax=Macrostomum lignano TaxID=282301 RepID=A0A267G9R8_9PLAT|nr:hypothetical protein BOX15_Mlig010739g1 [Macrostomum lignano]PAA82785.1 hypothetical protein BOX15_Mlig010739g3 [Macrostomum lignano]
MVCKAIFCLAFAALCIAVVAPAAVDAAAAGDTGDFQLGGLDRRSYDDQEIQALFEQFSNAERLRKRKARFGSRVFTLG